MRSANQRVGLARSNVIRRLAKLVRWREWYDSKLPMFLVAIFYAALSRHNPAASQLRLMASLIILLCFYAAFGHLINDYADRASDLAADKRRELMRLSAPLRLVAIIAPCFAAGCIAFLGFDRSTSFLVVAAFVTASVYSLPPVRLKERGALAWPAAAIAQRTLPVAIVFQAFHAWDWTSIGYTFLSTVIGLRFIVVHQLRDAANDRRSGVSTAATSTAPRRLIAILYCLFPLELVWLVTVTAAMAGVAPLLAPAGVGYAGYLVFKRLRGHPIDPVSYFVLAGFYQIIWPITLSIDLARRTPLFISTVILAVALVQHQIRSFLRECAGANTTVIEGPTQPR